MMNDELINQLKSAESASSVFPKSLIGKYLKTVIDFYNYLCKTKKPSRQCQNGCMVC